MLIELHERAPGQSRRCLQSLVAESKLLARTPRMQFTRSLGEVVAWIRAQPFLPDREGDPVSGLGAQDACRPHQRIRFWPEGGLNCWEATVHYVAAAIRHGLPRGYRLHVWDLQADHDTDIGRGVILHRGARHAFPELEGPDGKRSLVNLNSTVPRQTGPRALSGVRANDNWDWAALGVDAGGAILSIVASAYAGPETGQLVAKVARAGADKLREQSADKKRPEGVDGGNAPPRPKKKVKKKKGKEAS